MTVTGEAYALEKALESKQNANVVSDGISADDIGAIPEFGLGDALRKVPVWCCRSTMGCEEG